MYPDSTSVDYVYDLVGKIKQVTDPTGTYGFAYDNMGRLVGTTTQYTFLPGVTYNTVYTYDAASNRTGLAAPDGSTYVYQYDTMNRLTTLMSSWAGQFGFSYDGLSRRTQLTRPNGVTTNYTYDSVSHLLSVLHQAGGATIDGASYTYDAAGNRNSKTNYLNAITENYSYDAIYQLLQVTQGTTTTESYTYDPVGNRLSSLNVPLYNYNTSNQLTSNSTGSYTYDANGNTLADAQGRSYTWNFENRLTQAVVPGTNGGMTTFKYDPFGRRIQKSGPNGTTTYLYDGNNVLEELDQSGNALARYTQTTNIDEPLSASRSGTTYYHQAGDLGTVTSLSDSTGALRSTYSYDSYGNLSSSTGSVTNLFRYTGREFDQETSLYYYRARYYDPSEGRFLTEDSIQFEGGVNFYAYVGNNPLSYLDPTGFKKCKQPGPCDSDPKKLRLVPTSVEPGNHDIDYTLITVDGQSLRGTWYVYEHQTQAGGGRTNFGPGDNVSAIDASGEGNINSFHDSLTTWLNSVQRFTISMDPTYDPNCQTPVIIRYGDGRDYERQHLWQRGGINPVIINNYPTLPQYQK